MNALLTGAFGGIGSEILEGLLKAGYDVHAFFSRDQKSAIEKKDSLEKKYNQKITLHCVDFKNPQNVLDIKDQISTVTFDSAVFCAGKSVISLFQDVTLKTATELYNINYLSQVTLLRLILPKMIDEKRGKIVFLSSMWGRYGASCEADYSASKAALIGLVQALSKELGPSGITANAVLPGLIDTKMNENVKKEDLNSFVENEIPLSKIGTPKNVADTVLFLLGDGGDYITGASIEVTGGV